MYHCKVHRGNRRGRGDRNIFTEGFVKSDGGISSQTRH